MIPCHRRLHNCHDALLVMWFVVHMIDWMIGG